MKQLALDFVILLVLTFLLAFLGNRIMDLWFFRLAFPETIATEGLYWEDFVFKLRPIERQEDRVVLVNIGDGGRREIAQQIIQLSKYEPAVIGLEVFFNCPPGNRDLMNCPQLGDTLGNEALAFAIKEAANVVMVSRLLQKKGTDPLSDVYDSLELSDPQFMQHAQHGFANIVLHGEFREAIDGGIPIGEVREINPQWEVNKKMEQCFAARVVWNYDSTLAQKFLLRNKPYEWINFRGSNTAYNYYLGPKAIYRPPYLSLLDGDSLALGLISPDRLKNKIVLLGYLGDHLNDPAFESRFYTPLNSTFAGRSMPDMLGLTIHANIISMILNEDYIYELGDFGTWLITVAILVGNLTFFLWLFHKQSVWYDSVCFIVPIFQIVLYSWLRMELMADFNFRVDLENLIYLIAFVSFAVNLYYGPILRLISKSKKPQ